MWFIWNLMAIYFKFSFPDRSVLSTFMIVIWDSPFKIFILFLKMVTYTNADGLIFLLLFLGGSSISILTSNICVNLQQQYNVIIYRLIKYRKILLKYIFRKNYTFTSEMWNFFISKVKYYRTKCKICLSSSVNFVYSKKKNQFFWVILTFISSIKGKKIYISCVVHGFN